MPATDPSDCRGIPCDDYLGLPRGTAARIAEGRGATDPTLRGLLLACLAEPLEDTPKAELLDWLQEFVRRPKSVRVAGEDVPVGRRMNWFWWKFAAGLHRDTVRELTRRFHPGARPLANCGLSLEEVCSLSAPEVLGLDFVGPARLKQLRGWLAAHGLYLRGERPPAPDGDSRAG